MNKSQRPTLWFSTRTIDTMFIKMPVHCTMTVDCKALLRPAKEKKSSQLSDVLIR